MARFHSHRDGSFARMGSVTVYALIVLVVLLLVGLLAVNSAWMVGARTSLDGSADSAALAAAVTFVDDEVLLGDPVVMRALARSAAAEARKYGQLNPVTGEPLDIRANPENHPDGDVVFGFLEMPGRRFVPADLSGPSVLLINAARVRGRRTQERGNPIRLLGGFPNPLRCGNAESEATAVLDGDVIGFRPVFEPGIIPLVPLALRSDRDGSDELSWEHKVIHRGGADDWRFDRHRCSIVAGEDGLHEMFARLVHRRVHNKDDDGEDDEGDKNNNNNKNDKEKNNKKPHHKKSRSNVFVLALGDCSVHSLLRQIALGMRCEDLKEYSGEFVLCDDGALLVSGSPWSTEGTSELTAALYQGLKALQRSGEARAWPLYQAGSEQNGRARITGFVAARVANVQEADDKGRIAFELQPARMSTPAAVTASDRGRPANQLAGNPYIVKLRLVE